MAELLFLKPWRFVDNCCLPPLRQGLARHEHLCEWLLSSARGTVQPRTVWQSLAICAVATNSRSFARPRSCLSWLTFSFLAARSLVNSPWLGYACFRYGDFFLAIPANIASLISVVYTMLLNLRRCSGAALWLQVRPRRRAQKLRKGWQCSHLPCLIVLP